MLNRLGRHKSACDFDFSTEDEISKLKVTKKRGVEWGDFVYSNVGKNTIAKLPALATL
jgi:hypothetical protein